MKIPTLTTPRLLLRAFEESDVPRLHAILDFPNIVRYLPSQNPPSVDGVRKIIDTQLADWMEATGGLWAQNCVTLVA